MFLDGAKCIVPNFPIETIVPSKMTAERQFLERKDTRVLAKGVKTLRQEDIEIEVEAAKAIHGKIAKEVDTLNWEWESGKHIHVFREFARDEVSDGWVVEKAVLVVRVEEPCIDGRRLTGQRLLICRRLAALNDPLWNLVEPASQCCCTRYRMILSPTGAAG
jgi:hypothetical protein